VGWAFVVYVTAACDVQPGPGGGLFKFGENSCVMAFWSLEQPATAADCRPPC